MNISNLHHPRPHGIALVPQPRQYWNQRAYYKQDDFLPLPRAGIQNITRRVPDHVACQATRVLFACSHVLHEHLPCKGAGMRGKPCPLMNSYAPRHRDDVCIRCAAKEGNTMQVSDLLKPRHLFLQGDPADKYREYGGTHVWQPQKYRFDQTTRVGERKKAEQEERKTGVKDVWKTKPVSPLATGTKEKMKGTAPMKSR